MLLFGRVIIDAHVRRGKAAKFVICFALAWAILYLMGI
jgi:hypothetical protein